MKPSPFFYRCLRLAQVPSALLITFLQRLPVQKVIEIADEMANASPVGTLLKGSAAAAASLGALNTLAGATSLVTTAGSSTINGTVGTAITPVAFTITGTTSPAGAWTIPSGSQFPAGLSFSGLTGPGEVDTTNLPGSAPVLTGTPTKAGTYVVNLIAWENAGATGIESPEYSFTVIVSGSASAPSFTTVPQDSSGVAGTSLSLTSSASGAPTYQWQKNGANVAGATGATLTLSSPQKTDSGSYTVIATNSGGSTTSSAANLTIYAATDAPIFTVQPVSQTVDQGVTVNYNALAVGPGNITYQWKQGGSAISGQTGPTLTLSNVQLGAGGNYTVTAANSNGSTPSNSASLSVLESDTPVFTLQPASATVVSGATVTFTAVATDGSYQWYLNGKPISGATNPSLTVSNVSAANAGDYTVVADNTMTSDDGYGDISTTGGMTTSNAAVLTVNSVGAPVFTSQPQAQTVTSGATVTFTAAASGSATYQWEQNGVAISGATSATLTLTNVQPSANGSYSVIASNSGGTTQSAVASLTVNAPSTPAPAFTTQPQNQTVTVGQSVTFTAAASNSPTYQWQKNGTSISGATGATLTIASPQLTDAGTYTVTATNGGGTATSSSVTLTVNPASTVAAPAFTVQPVSQTIVPNTTVVFNMAVTGSPAPSFQWKLNGAAISGATNARLVISGAGTANAGAYTVNATNSQGTATSAVANLSVISTTNVGRLVNLSVNTVAGKSQPLTVGFVVGGSGTSGNEPLLIRADGPALAALGVGGALADPTLSVLSGSTVITSNDNWSTPSTNVALVNAADAATGAFPLPTNSLDAALVTSLASNPGYTVQVTGNTAASGIVVAEVYDNTANYTLASPRLINLSCNFSVAANGSLTEGFTVLGSTSKTVLIRATGPTLASLGVGGTMPDPQIALHATVSGNDTILASNAGWGGDPQIASVSANIGAFALVSTTSKDSVVLYTLAPGSYTAVASSVTGTAGVTVVEVYEVQ